jgi:hypothetical protein
MYTEDELFGIFNMIIGFAIIVIIVAIIAIGSCVYWVGTSIGVLDPIEVPTYTPTPIPTPYGVIDQFDGEYNVYNIKLPAEALITLLKDRQPGYTNLSIDSCKPMQVIGDGTFYSMNCTYQLNDISHKVDMIDWYSVGGINHITYAVRDGNYDLINQREMI